MTPEDRARCDRVAREVMGWIESPAGTWHRGGFDRYTWDPFHDDRDFCALLDRCVGRGWRPRLELEIGWAQVLLESPRIVVEHSDRRRALVPAALAAAEAERDGKEAAP